MKPIVDYEVAGTADPTPLKLLTSDPANAKYHTTWLENKWYPFIGFVAGAGSFIYGNAMARRPFYAGIHKTLGVGALAAYGAYLFKQYKTDYLADKDAMYRHYIQLHPEDFPPPDRKKVGEMFKEWVPVR